MENTTYSNMEKIAEEAIRNIKHKELETLIIASIETLKRQKVKCDMDEVLKLVRKILFKPRIFRIFRFRIKNSFKFQFLQKASYHNKILE